MMRSVLVSTALVLSACQTYDFIPVSPISLTQTSQSRDVTARRLKPNLMILVDKSGSMETPIKDADGGIGATCGTCGPGTAPCPVSCPNRIRELRSAMNSFLTSSGTIARMGLALFPADARCGATGQIAVPLPAPSQVDDAVSDMASQTNANAVNAAIQGTGTNPSGGTPTNDSLRFVGQTPGLNDSTDLRDDFVLLLTDGVPNCNIRNVNTCNSPNNACQCTLSSCVGSFCSEGCLDRQGVVEAVQELSSKGIKTIVVGFGIGSVLSDDQRNAPAVLNAMAEAGGLPLSCTTGLDADCGANNRCINNVCERKYFQATNGAELSQALAKISEKLPGTEPCIYPLDAQPAGQEYLAVIVDGQNQAPGPDTWAFTNGQIVFSGATCAKIERATPLTPVKVQVRIVSTL
ncbi:MAG: adventurous gliding motility lipoprotein CglB [Archangium sp.]|nr:adventurous gliding motility lipoprotein CglB [Archangium sp.]